MSSTLTIALPNNAKSRPRALAAELRKAILRGDLKPGDSLPSERELAEQLGLGRSTVREALAEIAHLGLVESERRTVVRPIEHANIDVLRHLLVLDGRPNLKVIEEYLEVVEILVAASVDLAIRRGSPADLQRAQHLLDQLVHPANGDRDYFAAFEELMELVADASQNLVLRLVRNAFKGFVRGDYRDALRVQLRPLHEDVEPVVRTLTLALDARDTALARTATRRLVRLGRERILEQLRPVSP